MTERPHRPPPATDAPKPGGGRTRRRLGRLCAAVLGALAVGAVFAGVLVWVVLSRAPVTLPERMTHRVEAQLNAVMAANGVSLGEMALSLASEPTQVKVTFRDLAMTDPDGAPRAQIPEVHVTFDSAGLLHRTLRPTQVTVAGAQLALRRDATGQIDLLLSNADAASTLSLEDSLARLDAMFGAAVFEGLQEITGQGLSLVMADEMTGQVMQVEDAALQLTRGGDGLRLAIGGALDGSRDTVIDLALHRDPLAAQTTIGLSFENLAARDLATVTPALAWLDLMRAPLSGTLQARLADDGRIGDLHGTLRIESGALSLAGAADPVPFDRLVTEVRYQPARARLAFERLDVTAPDLSFSAEGHADVAQDGQVFIGQLRLRDLTLSPAGVFPAPLAFDRGVLDLRLRLGPVPRLDIGQAVLSRDSSTVSARGTVTAATDGLDLALDLEIDRLSAAEMLALYPVSLTPRSRQYLSENLLAADLTGIEWVLRRRPGADPVSHLGFDFTGLDLQALRDLPPIRGASGYFALTQDRMALRLDGGQITAEGHAPIALAGSSMIVPDTRAPRAPVTYDLQIAGGLSDVLAVLEHPPMSLFAHGPMTRERVGTGTAEARVVVAARLGPRSEAQPGETRIAVEATISDYRANTLVPGRVLAAERLSVSVRPGDIAVSGAATLDGVPFAGQWSRPLGAPPPVNSRVEARVALSRDTLAALGVPLPPWLMAGQGAADVEIILRPDAPALLRAESDLAGVRLSLPSLGWSMAASRTGALSLEATLSQRPEVTDLRVEGGGLAFRGRVSPSNAAGYSRLSADRLRVGQWLDVGGTLAGQGPGRPPAIEITRGTVDLRQAPQSRAAATADAPAPVPITAQVQSLRISDGITLTDVSAEVTSANGLTGRFVGSVNGAASIIGTLAPGPDGQTVRVQANDGGAVLRAANVFRSAYGGPMDLTMAATGQAGSYRGDVRLDQPRLRGAPAMAELLNAISVVGLLDQMAGDGINLGEVDAQFLLTPSQVILQQGAAVGPSLGISLDGAFDLDAGQLDMQGVISPLYMVNGMIGAVFAPRREGLFGFAYRLTGAADAPQVTVNPLSILTPGIFRDIFRQPAPELTETQ